MRKASSFMPVHTAATSRKRRVQIVSCQGHAGFDVAAFSSVFEEANRLIGEQPVYEINSVRFEDQRIDGSRQGATLNSMDILVVAARADQESNSFGREAVSSLKQAVSLAGRVVGLGGGTFLLAALGLLASRRAVVHWTVKDKFQKRFPILESDGDTLYAEHGRVFTCAGGVASIDCALALVELDFGSQVAGEIARILLLPYRRGSDAAQMSSLLRSQVRIPDRLSQLLAWLPDHLQGDLSVKALAKRAAMSTRNFARIFHKQLGMTPALYVEHLRLQTAQRELRRSFAPLPQIAEISGFNNPETLRRIFLKHLGVTPGNFRRSRVDTTNKLSVLEVSIQALLPEYRFDTLSIPPAPALGHVRIDDRLGL